MGVADRVTDVGTPQPPEANYLKPPPLLLLLLLWWSGIPFTNIVAGRPAGFWKQSSGCRVKARPAVFCCFHVVGGIGIGADAYELNMKFVGYCTLLSSYVKRHLPHVAVYK